MAIAYGWRAFSENRPRDLTKIFFHILRRQLCAPCDATSFSRQQFRLNLGDGRENLICALLLFSERDARPTKWFNTFSRQRDTICEKANSQVPFPE